MYRFYKRGKDWWYKQRGCEVAKPVDTFALESILGVVGGPEVIVVRTDPTTDQVINVTLKNGFITEVDVITEVVDSSHNPSWKKTPITEFCTVEITQ